MTYVYCIRGCSRACKYVFVSAWVAVLDINLGVTLAWLMAAGKWLVRQGNRNSSRRRRSKKRIKLCVKDNESKMFLKVWIRRAKHSIPINPSKVACAIPPPCIGLVLLSLPFYHCVSATSLLRLFTFTIHFLPIARSFHKPPPIIYLLSIPLPFFRLFLHSHASSFLSPLHALDAPLLPLHPSPAPRH